MAKATATCTCKTCGKEFEVSAIKYNRREADSWAVWASDHYIECDDCYKARLAKERDAENTRAAEAAISSGLRDLEGSDKQVAWATTIRQKALQKVADDCEMSIAVLIARAPVVRWASNQTDARWWIDHRDGLGKDSVAAICNVLWELAPAEVQDEAKRVYEEDRRRAENQSREEGAV